MCTSIVMLEVYWCETHEGLQNVSAPLCWDTVLEDVQVMVQERHVHEKEEKHTVQRSPIQ